MRGSLFKNKEAFVDILQFHNQLNIEKNFRLFFKYLAGYEIEGNAQMLIEFEGNISAVVSYSAYSGPHINETNIYFTKGVIKLKTGNSVWVSKGDDFQEVQIDEPADSFRLMWQDFLADINNNAPVFVNGNYGKEIISALQQVYKQNMI